MLKTLNSDFRIVKTKRDNIQHVPNTKSTEDREREILSHEFLSSSIFFLLYTLHILQYCFSFSCIERCKYFTK